MAVDLGVPLQEDFVCNGFFVNVSKKGIVEIYLRNHFTPFYYDHKKLVLVQAPVDGHFPRENYLHEEHETDQTVVGMVCPDHDTDETRLMVMEPDGYYLMHRDFN